MRKTLAIAVAAVALTLGGAGRCSGRGHHHPSRARHLDHGPSLDHGPGK